MEPTTLLGRVLTGDPASPRVAAISFGADGRIRAVGPADVVAEACPDARVVDLGDRVILPGFIDAHHHLSISALYEGTPRLAPPDVLDIPSLQATLATAAKAAPADRWLIASQLDESRLRERRVPRREELDACVPDRPLFVLHHTCHRALANTKALELAGIDAKTAEPSGGAISRGPGGVPDGLLIERAMAPVEQLARADRIACDRAGILERMARHYRAVRRAGITRLCDTAVPVDLFPLYRELAARGDVVVPTHVCPVSVRGWLPEPVDALDGPPSGEALAEDLLVGPVKLVFDGAPGCSMCLSWGQALVSIARTFAMSARVRSLDPLRTAMSITPRYGRDVRSGVAIYAPGDAERIVASVVDHRFGLATHALGNAAIDVALDAYAAAGSRLHAGGVARLEHAAFATALQARRMADLGVAAIVQPAMLEMHMTSTAPRIPGLPFFPLRRLVDAGVLVVGSSDFPVHTFDPLVGIRAAVRRENARGDVVDPDERLSLDEAIALYTEHGAEALGVARETGTLAVGKRADLVVIDGFDDDAPEVRSTYVAGRLAVA